MARLFPVRAREAQGVRKYAEVDFRMIFFLEEK